MAAMIGNKCAHMVNRLVNLTFLQAHCKHRRYLHTSFVLQKVVQFNLSDIGEGIREVTIKEWFVKVGDTVTQFDNICEVQSDKASVTITSRYDGKISKIHHDVDGIALVGNPLLDFEVVDEEEVEEEERKKAPSSSNLDEKPRENEDNMTFSSVSPSRVLATPAVRRIAMQHSLDLWKVEATGRGGRVLKGDVLKHLNITDSDTVYGGDINIHSPVTSDPSISRNDSAVVDTLNNVIPLKGITKVMFKTMTASLKIPHFSCSDEIDITKLVEVRKSIQQRAASKGIKLTYMPFFIKAASLSLLKYPILNSSLDATEENIILKADHNITIAMDSLNGLVVPNIKNVQNKTVLEIAKNLNYLQEAGQKGALKLDDLAGGTFSLSNIGNIGGTYTHPVILSPQVAIGAIGKAQVLPRFSKDGETIIKSYILTVSWSADHRIIDGATMVKFSQEWKNYLENPNLLMLDF